MSVFAFMQLQVQFSRNLNTYYLLHKRRLAAADAQAVEDAMTFM